jgi:hypothetical protein
MDDGAWNCPLRIPGFLGNVSHENKTYIMYVIENHTTRPLKRKNVYKVVYLLSLFLYYYFVHSLYLLMYFMIL